MKKIFTLIFVIALTFCISNTAIATGPVGSLNVGAHAMDGAIDGDYQWIPNGSAFGISGAFGKGGAHANGFIINGVIEGEVTAVGGGITSTDSYWLFMPVPDADLSIGVGSASQSAAVTGATVKVKVDPLMGFGVANGYIHGFAAQGTLNSSHVGPSPIFFSESTGISTGTAGQGSMGGFRGGVFAIAFGGEFYFGGEPGGPGYYVKRNGQTAGKVKYFPNGHPENQSEWDFLGAYRCGNTKAGAGAGANISMTGYSYSESFRYVDWGDGTKTEGMGTLVGAGTRVDSEGYAFDWDKGFSYADGHVHGGWSAMGGASSTTIQMTPGFGGATATAVGMYSACGPLNTNYTGSARYEWKH
jgi:hypothetical protein